MKRSRRVTPVYKRRRRRKRRVVDAKRFVLCIVALALVFELLLTLFSSPYFAIRDIRISGNKLIPAQQVVESLQPVSGKNIFLTRSREVIGLVSKNPIVADVRIHRRLPRTLMVDVTERKPHFTLSTGGALYDVDRSSIAYRVIKTPHPGLPIISCKVPGRVVLGKPVKSPAYSSARACLLLTQSKNIPGVTKIWVDQSGYLCLNVRGNLLVKLGRPEQLSEKLDLVGRTLEQVPEIRQRGLYIDVTCPEAPAIKLAE